MNRQLTHRHGRRLLLAVAAAILVGPASWAQVPVDENGNPIEPLSGPAVEAGARVESVPAEALMTADELQALVGPIALYPDDLLAIVLPASTYPLEVVQAARFLEQHEENDDLEPDGSWDDSVVALLNYPEVLEMMNDDIDWTWRLGTAVANQQADVIAAVEAFRDRAYAAGNLKTDQYQTVTENGDGVIEIEPVSEEIIYVPYYEPERVVVYQPRPAYYYYPRPYPVYYYPYPYGYNFYANYFWGVTTAFTIGWSSHNLHVFHHSYWGHPYYGRTYYPHWWYRRPSITVYNTWYGDYRREHTRDHYANGDLWRPRHTGGARPGFARSRADYYRDRRRELSSDGYRDRPAADRAGRTAPVARSDDRRSGAAGRPGFRGEDGARSSLRERSSEDSAIRFREREGRVVTPSANRERAAGNAERRATTTRNTRQAAGEQRPAVADRTERSNRREVSSADISRRLAESRSRTEPAVRRSETRRESVTPAPRASAPVRNSAPRSVSRPSSSVTRSTSRPAAGAPRSVSRSSSGPSSRPSSSSPQSVSRPSVSRPSASAPRSVSRPAASAPRSSAPRPSVSRPSSSAPRPSVSRPSSSSARRAEAPSSSERRVRQR